MSNEEINIEVEGYEGSANGSSEQIIEKRKEIIDESDEDEVDDPLKLELHEVSRRGSEDSLPTLENTYEDRAVFDPYSNIMEDGKLNFATKNNKNYLKVFSLTWNMMGLSSPNEEYLLSFIPTSNYHMYCFATQECERSIGTSVIIESKAKWEKTLNSVMGDSYVQLESCTLVAIHIIIFVRKELLTQISNLKTCSVATGLYNQIGNKGGVSISFKLGKRKFIFINSHLPAHQENVKERNESVKRIIDSVEYEGKIQQQPSKTKVNPAVSQSNFTLFKRADRPDILKKNNFVFFLGDLNYRINGNRKVVDKVLKMNDLKVLQLNDQLILERKKGTVDLKHFSEGEITFPPTYKFEKNSNLYDLSKKQRVPAWTDRILFKPSKKGKIHLVDYNFFPQAKYSDHRPVYASFLVDCPGVNLENTNNSSDASTSQVKKMFITVAIKDTLIIKPERFKKDIVTAVEDEIHMKYSNKILPDVGLCVSIYDFISIGDPHIYPNQQGNYFVEATFRLIVFKPFVGEIVTGRIMGSDPEQGLKVAIGFFNDIYIPPYLLAQPCKYDEDTNQWQWIYEDNALPYAHPQEIRFRVNSLTFNTTIDSNPPRHTEDRNKQTLEDTQDEKAPMIITGRANEPGLGLTSWWQTGEEEQQ